MTTSTASTPICNPQLPPEIVMNAGALQPSAVRQVATPLPPSAPKTNPPFTMCGITATHLACSNTSSGIPLSGIPIISCNTVVALSSRAVASSRADAAEQNVPRLNIANTNIIFFIEQPLLCILCAPYSIVPCLAQRIGLENQAQQGQLNVSSQERTGLSNNAHRSAAWNCPTNSSKKLHLAGGQFCSDLRTVERLEKWQPRNDFEEPTTWPSPEKPQPPCADISSKSANRRLSNDETQISTRTHGIAAGCARRLLSTTEYAGIEGENRTSNRGDQT